MHPLLQVNLGQIHVLKARPRPAIANQEAQHFKAKKPEKESMNRKIPSNPVSTFLGSWLPNSIPTFLIS